MDDLLILAARAARLHQKHAGMQKAAYTLRELMAFLTMTGGGAYLGSSLAPPGEGTSGALKGLAYGAAGGIGLPLGRALWRDPEGRRFLLQRGAPALAGSTTGAALAPKEHELQGAALGTIAGLTALPAYRLAGRQSWLRNLSRWPGEVGEAAASKEVSKRLAALQPNLPESVRARLGPEAIRRHYQPELEQISQQAARRHLLTQFGVGAGLTGGAGYLGHRALSGSPPPPPPPGSESGQPAAAPSSNSISGLPPTAPAGYYRTRYGQLVPRPLFRSNPVVPPPSDEPLIPETNTPNKVRDTFRNLFSRTLGRPVSQLLSNFHRDWRDPRPGNLFS